jgi:rhodanese-related sulfurtransferase
MQTMLKQTLIEAIIVLALSVVLCLVVTALRPPGLALFRQSPERGVPADQPTATSAIPLAEAVQRFDDGKTLFADARSPEDYAAGHVDGAFSLSLYQFDEWIADFLVSTAPETPIVTYCEGADCYLARELAERLAELGFETVFFLEDGWGQWQAQGLPAATGPALP